jgi:hypothetical protein
MATLEQIISSIAKEDDIGAMPALLQAVRDVYVWYP